MITIAVLTEQRPCLNQIKEITKRNLVSLGISYELKEYIHPQDLFNDLSEHKICNMFLLDMDISGCSAFEIAHRIKIENMRSKIIFITNQVEYSPETYEANPYRYLPKKLLVDKLPEAYKFFYEKDREKIEFEYSLEGISAQEIYFLKKERAYTLIIHKNGQIKIKRTFSEVLKELDKISCFSVINKNCVVNILHVMSLKKFQVYLRDGNILSVDMKYSEQFMKDICRFFLKS